jgi:hypothetical protein
MKDPQIQNAQLVIAKAGGTLCATKIKRFKFPKFQSGGDVAMT